MQMNSGRQVIRMAPRTREERPATPQEPQHGAALASRRIPDEPDCTRARRYENVRMIRELKTPRAGRLPLRKVTHKAYVTVCH